MTEPTQDQPQVVIPDLCATHQQLLVQQARYTPVDPWRALIVVTNIALFQGATCDPKVHMELGGDVTKVGQLGCLACRKPDLFGEIVEVAKKHDLGGIKALAERWVAASKKTDGAS